MPQKSNLLHFPKPAEPDPLNSADYDQLLRDLIEEFRPADAVEHSLIKQMAAQRELMDRWTVLQQRAFTTEAIPKDLAMMMRQHSAAERSFHLSLKTLLNLRKQRST